MSNLSSSPNYSEPAEAPAQSLSRFSVRAVSYPSVLSRVVELFALRNIVPERVRLDRAGLKDELRIDVEVAGLAFHDAGNIARRMRTFPTVVGVLLQRD